MDEAGGQAPLRRLRQERNRFLAFAFAAADLLIEVDGEGRILYAAGSTRVLLGRGAEELVGKAFIDLTAAYDRAMFRQILRRLEGADRIAPVRLRLASPKGGAVPMLLSGYRLPDLADHRFLALSVMRQARSDDEGRDRASGLLDAESFSEAARLQALKASIPGEGGRLTLVELPEATSLDRRMADNLAAEVGAVLRAYSLDGETAGRLDPTRYGVVHDETLTRETIAGRIADVAKTLMPKRASFDVRAATLDLVQPGVDPGDLAQAVVYTVNRFSSEKGEGLTLDALAKGYQSRLAETVTRIRAVRELIERGTFDLAYQPIVEIATKRLHHFEVLSRFPGGEASPQETIAFAEDTGLIRSLDMTIARRTITLLTQTDLVPERTGLAVNLSGRSLGDPTFMDELVALLAANPEVKGRLLFEVTESHSIRDLDAANASIQVLRKAGYPMCLDDLGAGAAAFQYLRSLQVDYVKIDGSYIRDMLKTSSGAAFVRAMTTLAVDLGMAAIAEMVEDAKTAEALYGMGVTYAQGYLYGRPNASFGAFTDLPRYAETQHGRGRR